VLTGPKITTTVGKIKFEYRLESGNRNIVRDRGPDLYGFELCDVSHLNMASILVFSKLWGQAKDVPAQPVGLDARPLSVLYGTSGIGFSLSGGADTGGTILKWLNLDLTWVSWTKLCERMSLERG